MLVPSKQSIKPRKKQPLKYKLEIDKDNPLKAKIFKLTRNPAYQIEINLEIEKIGIFHIIKIECEKIYLDKASDFLQEIDFCAIGFGKQHLAKNLRQIIMTDMVYSLLYTRSKLLLKKIEQNELKEDFKFKGFRLSQADLKRVRRFVFSIIDKLISESKEWAEALSVKYVLLGHLFDYFIFNLSSPVRSPKIKKIDSFKIKRAEELSEQIKKGYFLKDFDNFYAMRKFCETSIETSEKWSARGILYQDLAKNLFPLLKGRDNPLDFKPNSLKQCQRLADMICVGIPNILNAKSLAKKKTISTWPKVVIGINNLPYTEFNRHVTNKLELKAHLAFFDAMIQSKYSKYGTIIQRTIRISILIGKIIKIVQKSTCEEIKTAYRCFKRSMRRREIVSYKMLMEMFTYVIDSIEIFSSIETTTITLDDESAISFEEGIINCKSLKKVIELGIDIHHNHNRYITHHGKNKIRNIQLQYPTINPNFVKDGVKVTFLDTTHKIVEEGNLMKHCISSYIKEAADGTYLVFHIEYNGYMATASLRKVMIIGKDDTKKTWMFSQCHGPRNQDNKSVKFGKEILMEWAEKYNSYLSKIRNLESTFTTKQTVYFEEPYREEDNDDFEEFRQMEMAVQ